MGITLNDSANIVPGVLLEWFPAAVKPFGGDDSSMIFIIKLVLVVPHVPMASQATTSADRDIDVTISGNQVSFLLIRWG